MYSFISKINISLFYRADMRWPPSRRMTFPFIMGFSIICNTNAPNSSGLPSLGMKKEEWRMKRNFEHEERTTKRKTNMGKGIVITAEGTESVLRVFVHVHLRGSSASEYQTSPELPLPRECHIYPTPSPSPRSSIPPHLHHKNCCVEVWCRVLWCCVPTFACRVGGLSDLSFKCCNGGNHNDGPAFSLPIRLLR